jgi:hypothetical protein
LQKQKKWANENKMHFNEIKSKVMLITRKRNNENGNHTLTTGDWKW